MSGTQRETRQRETTAKEAAGAANETDPARLAALGDAFAGWLGPRLGADGPVTVAPMTSPPLNGSSNQTLFIDATWSAGGVPASGRFVVRMAPRGRRLYHVYDLDLQYRTMAALDGTGVPLPPLIGYEPDASVAGEPFYVMARVEGDAPPDLPPFTAAGWVRDASPATQAALHDNGLATLARIHRVDPGRVQIDGLARGFDDLFARTEAWYRWATAAAANPFLDRVLDWLREHRPAELSPDVVNWGDARPGNLLYRGVEPVAVLDWEMASIAPPEVDLGWWLFLYRHHTDAMGHPRLPGFPPDAEVADRYAQLAGRPVRHLHYFEVFAGFRFAIIVHRAMDALGERRATVDNTATRQLAVDLGWPPPAAAPSGS